MDSGIYRIEIGPKWYWGSSSRFESRKREHFWQLKNGRHPNIHMQRAYDKYLDFSMDLVVYSCENILEIEQEFLDEDYGEPLCMNLSRYATSPMRGRTHSEESKKKMSKAQSGRKNPMYGVSINTGADNHFYSDKMHHFIHKDGRVHFCTQYYLQNKYGLGKNISNVITGARKSHYGWRIEK